MSHVEHALDKIAGREIVRGQCPAHNVIKQRLADLSNFCRDVTPARVVGEPDRADALNIVDDLKALAERVDRVVAAYGEYAVYSLGMSGKSLTLFRDQLRDALDGSALFMLSEIGEELENSRRKRARA